MGRGNGQSRKALLDKTSTIKPKPKSRIGKPIEYEQDGIRVVEYIDSFGKLQLFPEDLQNKPVCQEFKNNQLIREIRIKQHLEKPVYFINGYGQEAYRIIAKDLDGRNLFVQDFENRNKPVAEYFQADNLVKDEFRWRNSKGSSVYGCKREFHPQQQIIKSETQYLDGKERLVGEIKNSQFILKPTRIEYSKTGKIEAEYFYDHGQLESSFDKPSVIYYHSNGQKKAELYHRREDWDIPSKLHREGGPAAIEYNQTGEIVSEQYYLNGKLQK